MDSAIEIKITDLKPTKARKPGACILCQEPIDQGTIYMSLTYKKEGKYSGFRFCNPCADGKGELELYESAMAVVNSNG